MIYVVANATWYGAGNYVRPSYHAADATWYVPPVDPEPGPADDALRLYCEGAYAAPAAGAAALCMYVAAWSAAPVATWRTLDRLAARRLPLAARQLGAVPVTVETTAAPETIGWWLYHLLGSVRSIRMITDSGPGRYRHTFSLSTLPSLTAERWYEEDGRLERLTGLCVASASLSLEPGSWARLSLALVGARQTLVFEPLAAQPRDDGHTAWQGRQVALQMGLTAGTVASFQITIDNRLSASPFAMLGKPVRPAVGRAALITRLSAVMTDLDWLTRALAGTAEDITLTMTNPAGTLILTLSGCHLQPASTPLDTEAGTIVDLLIQVGDLSAVLINDLPSVLP